MSPSPRDIFIVVKLHYTCYFLVVVAMILMTPVIKV